MIREITIVITALSITACSIMPLSSEISARSNGKGNFNTEAGASLYIDELYDDSDQDNSSKIGFGL